jgi:hypothetical protein
MYRLSLAMLLVAASARADGPGDNLPDKVRPVPPPGIRIADTDREELQKGSDELGQQIESLPKELHNKPGRLGKETFKAEDHVPVLIYPNPLNPKR